jgi:predicted 3-demethylubiquinone-9 3-methyltransferase (glyoxalase superfamily)
MPKLTSCLWFDNQGLEAARFYTSVFKNSTITDVTYYGDAGPGTKGDVLTVSFELDGHPFVALNGGPHFTFSEAISFQIDCQDQAEVDYFWTTLSEGGREDQCGWLKDRFGLSWQVVPGRLVELISSPDAATAERAMKAMLGMKKIQIDEVERAARGSAALTG